MVSNLGSVGKWGKLETGFLDNKLLHSVNCDKNAVIALVSTSRSWIAQLEHGASLIFNTKTDQI